MFFIIEALFFHLMTVVEIPQLFLNIFFPETIFFKAKEMYL
jgi:hypothetical protein